MDRHYISAKVRKVRATCRQVEELAISLIRNPYSTMEDIKLMRET